MDTIENARTEAGQAADARAKAEASARELEKSIPNLSHVVILGAGASRAAFPDGDRNGRRLPLMSDLAEVVGMKAMLQEWGIDYRQNFECIFSDLHEKNELGKMAQIRNRVESYFRSLELPDRPTLYDHLFLSMSKTDVIATFNWDPLLPLAMQRNMGAFSQIPRVVFLHGNVEIGYCEKDKTYGSAGQWCATCKTPYKSLQLLYPVRQKGYREDPFIKTQWDILQWGMKRASMLTVFGYSSPKADAAAFDLMKNAWKGNAMPEMVETMFIVGPDQKNEEVEARWKPFIHSHHYTIYRDFYESLIANRPRRTGQAYFAQFWAANPKKHNPIPRDLGLAELRKWLPPA